MRKDDVIRFHHMLDAAREAVEFVRSRTRSELVEAYKLQGFIKPC